MDVAYAESILLRPGERFDDEPRRFIRNIETIDLQAVPGSGKTTALLAKLLILEKHLPFADGSGILVLSHTNAAIDEIRRRIGTACPRLFGYPNFVGTIQGFVDQFLAIPYYCSRYGKRPFAIDDGLYSEHAARFCRTCLPGFATQDQRNAKRYLIGMSLATRYRLLMKEGRLSVAEEINGRDLNFRKPKGKTKKENYSDFSPKEKSEIRRWLIEFKKKLLVEEGILHFDDAYFLAQCFLLRHPVIRRLVQRRFRYVFVDEMQDMDKHQYEILEEIFQDDDAASVYQRIGDKSQAIYSGKVKLESDWVDRSQVLPLTGSLRLSPSIAKVVEPFGIPRVPIEGKNSRAGELPPHVIVYDDESKEKVISRFCRLVKTHQDAGAIPKQCEHPISAVAWRKDDQGLKGYWSGYEAEAAKTGVDHACLKEYVWFARQENWQVVGLGPIHKKLMTGLLKILRMEGVPNPSTGEGYISARSLTRYLRETPEHTPFYDKFRTRQYQWSISVYRGQLDEAYRDVKKFVPQLLGIFGKQLNRAGGFVSDESICANAERAERILSASNVYQCPTTGIEVHVGTVHSAKGRTHTATLYLESSYRGSYESKRLSGQFGGQEIDDRARDIVKQSARMVYVGFSRPTHLLCFAVHKDRRNEEMLRNRGWEIVYAEEEVVFLEEGAGGRSKSKDQESQ